MKSLSTVAKSLMTSFIVTPVSFVNCEATALSAGARRASVHSVSVEDPVEVPLVVLGEAEHPVSAAELSAVIRSAAVAIRAVGVTFIGGPSCSM
jgi:hypothetical protein